MKTYQNPQPQAVERADKTQEKSNKNAVDSKQRKVKKEIKPSR